MKYIILLLFIISQFCAQDNSDILEIKDLFDLFFQDKEYQINKEIIRISIPSKMVHYNIKAILKGKSEFNFRFNKSNDEEMKYIKIKEKSFDLNNHLNDDYDEPVVIINIQEPEKHNIVLTIECVTLPYESLFVKVIKEYCEKVKDNIKKIMQKAYIFLDIAKNPKQPDGFPEYFKKVDFIKELNNIKTEDRTYYEFYRDIKEALGKFQDLHLNIVSLISPNGIDLEKSYACLPFSFYIQKDKNNVPKLYIELESTKDFFPNISEKLELLQEYPLSSINGSTPFDYIQNFIGNKYGQTKNRHATFSFNIMFNNAGKFSLDSHPLTKEELSDINFTFENGESLTLSYYFVIVKLGSFTDEFYNFFQEEKKNYETKIKFPIFFEIENKYLHNKNIINDDFNKKKIKNKNFFKLKEEGEEEEIEWDIELIEDESVKLKCRVDHKNQVNVLVQNDFMLKNITEAITDISTCCQVFHLNEYPIIIIEARNGGGIADLALLFMELLQTAFDSTEYISFKPDDIVFSGNSLPFTNPNTCEYQIQLKTK